MIPPANVKLVASWPERLPLEVNISGAKPAQTRIADGKEFTVFRRDQARR
jgi:hypothetical protein